MTPTSEKRPADPARLSPMPFPQLRTLSRGQLLHDLFSPLLMLALAGLFFWLSGLLPPELPKINFLHYSFGLLAVALVVSAGAELWENLRFLPQLRRSTGEIKLVAPPSRVRIVAAALGHLLQLLWAILLIDLKELWFISWPLALGMGAVALSGLVEVWRRGRQQRQQRPAARPEAHRLPPRQPARRSFRFTTNSPQKLLMRLLILGVMCWLVLLMPYAIVQDFANGRLQWASLGLWLLMLLVIVNSARAHIWRWQRWRYDAKRDTFHCDRRRWFHWQEERRWSAADFCGLYLDRADDYPQLWLAGPAGAEDVPLLTLTYWLRPNDRDARTLAENLSAASGLPLLYRWPAPPLELFKG